MISPRIIRPNRIAQSRALTSISFHNLETSPSTPLIALFAAIAGQFSGSSAPPGKGSGMLTALAVDTVLPLPLLALGVPAVDTFPLSAPCVADHAALTLLA